MKKKITVILLILIILVILTSIGLYYLNTYYLPQKLKIQITQTLSEKFDSVVQLENIKFSIFKGLVLYNLELTDRGNSTPTLKIGRLSATFLILPSFKQRRIIFPSINMQDAQLNIIRSEDSKFNIEKLIPKGETLKKSSGSLPFLIYKINVSDSSISFLDEAMRPNIQHTLKLDSFTIRPNPSNVGFRLQARLINKNQSTPLELSGKFEFKSRELNTNLRIKELNILPYLKYLSNLPVNVEALNLSDINSECVFVKDKLAIKINTNITNAYLRKDKTLISNAQAILNATFNIDLKNKANLDYLINLDNIKANLSNSQIPDNVIIQNAKLKIIPNRAEIKDAKVNIADIPIDLSGTLENFLDPTFNFNLKSSLDLKTAQNIAKNYQDFVKTVSVEGKVDIELNVSKLKDKSDLEFNGSLNLENAYIRAKNNSYSIKAINGLINFDEDNINWTNLSLNLWDDNFSSQASISNLGNPSINLELQGQEISLKTKINSVQKDIFDIDLFELKYLDSNVNVSGRLTKQAPDIYYLNLNLQSQINLSNLNKIEQLSRDNLAKINPEGICRISGQIQGDAKNLKALNSLLELRSDEVKLYGFRLKNIQMQLALRNEQIKIPQSMCTFYDGSLSLNGLIDLQEGSPYAFKMTAEEIDLSMLKLDTPLKDKTLKGIFSSSLILSGTLKSPQDIKGQGNFLIRDGYLWEFNPLKKLGDFLFIPRYQTLIFKEAQADFSIRERKLITDNLKLTSDIIYLSCEGNIDFDGNLDFEITPVPISQTSDDSLGYEDILNEQLFKLAGISVILLKGTIQDPKIETRVMTKDVLDSVKDTVGKVKDEVIDKFKGIISDLIFGSPK